MQNSNDLIQSQSSTHLNTPNSHINTGQIRNNITQRILGPQYLSFCCSPDMLGVYHNSGDNLVQPCNLGQGTKTETENKKANKDNSSKYSEQ